MASMSHRVSGEVADVVMVEDQISHLHVSIHYRLVESAGSLGGKPAGAGDLQMWLLQFRDIGQIDALAGQIEAHALIAEIVSRRTFNFAPHCVQSGCRRAAPRD